MTDKGISKFVDILRDLVKEELDHRDSTVVCKVVDKKKNDTGDYRYDLCVEPDEQNTIKNIQNGSNSEIFVNDYVYVYKINNQLNNCFIFKKITNCGSPMFSEVLIDKLSNYMTREEIIQYNKQLINEIKVLNIKVKELEERMSSL